MEVCVRREDKGKDEDRERERYIQREKETKRVSWCE